MGLPFLKGTPHELAKLQELFQLKSIPTMSQMESPAQCHNADDVGTCERRLALRDITNVHPNSVDPDDYMSDVSMIAIGLSNEDEVLRYLYLCAHVSDVCAI